jgi:hypothetical protein
MFLFACAVCGFGEDPSQWAYLAMTLFLSAVPLSMIAAGWFWVVRTMREAEKEASSPPVATSEKTGP